MLNNRLCFKEEAFISRQNNSINMLSYQFINELQQALDNNTLKLPSLPEVVLKICDAVDSNTASTKRITGILAQDTSMSESFLKIVNSPLYGEGVPVTDVQTAVNQLGGHMVRNMVVNFSLKQMFQPGSEVVDAQFRRMRINSINAAAICQMMSSMLSTISTEQAILAGLIHNIGSLPILRLAEKNEELINDTVTLSSIIIDLQGLVGAMILKDWEFSEELVQVGSECFNFKYTHDGEADLVDLVQCSLLLSGGVSNDAAPDDRNLVPAFKKLGIDPANNILDIQENQAIIDQAKQSLMT